MTRATPDGAGVGRTMPDGASGDYVRELLVGGERRARLLRDLLAFHEPQDPRVDIHDVVLALLVTIDAQAAALQPQTAMWHVPADHNTRRPLCLAPSPGGWGACTRPADHLTHDSGNRDHSYVSMAGAVIMWTDGRVALAAPAPGAPGGEG